MSQLVDDLETETTVVRAILESDLDAVVRSEGFAPSKRLCLELASRDTPASR